MSSTFGTIASPALSTSPNANIWLSTLTGAFRGMYTLIHSALTFLHRLIGLVITILCVSGEFRSFESILLTKDTSSVLVNNN